MKKSSQSRLQSPVKKRLVLIIGLSLPILWLIWGNITLQISHFEISDSKVPAAFNGFKIAHLSDLHDKNWGPTLVQPIHEEQPDIIVITGDLIHSETPDIYHASELITQIKDVAPIYYVTGNHEAWTEHYPLLKENLLDQGVIILENHSVKLERDHQELLLLGVHDPEFAPESNFLNEQVAIVESKIQELCHHDDGYKILLSHRPELFEAYVRHDVNLVLAGHAHGGQFRLPFIGGLFAPGQGFFSEYTSGVYEGGSTKMVVSRGLGNSTIPIRINNRPELIFIELTNR